MYLGHGFGTLMNFGVLGIFALLFQALVVIGIVFLIVYAIRTLVRHDGGGGHSSHRTSAERILAERFARGEISAEEYRSMRDELRK